MTREEFVSDVAELIAGLQVPMSLGMPLGAAREPWSRLNDALGGFGWNVPENYVDGIITLIGEWAEA